MKKMMSYHKLNKMAKGALVVALAGTFTFGASNVFAAGNDEPSSSQSEVKQETPTLLPGDFFYFAKTLLEKIQLALTFDDVKEAKLLADQASERLAEAQALFASGDQQKAVDTIKSALDAMNIAQNKVENTEAKDKDEQAKAQTASTNTADEEKPSTDSEHVKEVKKVKDHLAHTIKVLQAALEKGNKSEAAKKAISKNIAKLSARLADQSGQAGKDDNSTDSTPVTTDTNTATSVDSTNSVDSTTSTDETVADDAATVAPDVSGTATEAGTAAAETSTTPAAPAVSSPAAPAVNHGKVVSEVAKQKTPASAKNHGQAVSAVAKKQETENHGKQR